MNWDAMAAMAEIAAAIGVIASFVYVGTQVRRSTAQSRLENWSNMVDRLIGVHIQASNIEKAELIAKGRNGYKDLSEAEKIAFGAHMEQLCIALEGILHVGGYEVESQEASRALFYTHIKHHVDCVGGRDWFEEFQRQRGFPQELTNAIKQAIDSENTAV